MIDPDLELLILRGLVELQRIANALDRAYPEKVSPIRPPDDHAAVNVTPEMRARWQKEDDDEGERQQQIAYESLR